MHIGDLVDNHAISFHDTDPNGMSAEDEIAKSVKTLRKWYRAFPKARLCKGNHDVLVKRKGRSQGLPRRVLRDFRDIWEMPRGWEIDWNHYVCGVRYQHGTGYSGKYPHLNLAIVNRQPTVIGHCHSVSGLEFSANDKDMIFGMSVGCGIDRNQYTFFYGKDFKFKPILSCGVVIEGKYPYLIPMNL